MLNSFDNWDDGNIFVAVNKAYYRLQYCVYRWCNLYNLASETDEQGHRVFSIIEWGAIQQKRHGWWSISKLDSPKANQFGRCQVGFSIRPNYMCVSFPHVSPKLSKNPSMASMANTRGMAFSLRFDDGLQQRLQILAGRNLQENLNEICWPEIHQHTHCHTWWYDYA